MTRLARLERDMRQTAEVILEQERARKELDDSLARLYVEHGKAIVRHENEMLRRKP